MYSAFSHTLSFSQSLPLWSWVKLEGKEMSTDFPYTAYDTMMVLNGQAYEWAFSTWAPGGHEVAIPLGGGWPLLRLSYTSRWCLVGKSIHSPQLACLLIQCNLESHSHQPSTAPTSGTVRKGKIHSMYILEIRNLKWITFVPWGRQSELSTWCLFPTSSVKEPQFCVM